ncbi:hypothetical protein ACLOJK_003686 [Asimina triloba]
MYVRLDDVLAGGLTRSPSSRKPGSKREGCLHYHRCDGTTSMRCLNVKAIQTDMNSSFLMPPYLEGHGFRHVDLELPHWASFQGAGKGKEGGVDGDVKEDEEGAVLEEGYNEGDIKFGMLGEAARAAEQKFEGPTVHVLEEQGHVTGRLANDTMAVDQVGGVDAAKDVNVTEDLGTSGVGVDMEELEDAHGNFGRKR